MQLCVEMLPQSPSHRRSYEGSKLSQCISMARREPSSERNYIKYNTRHFHVKNCCALLAACNYHSIINILRIVFSRTIFSVASNMADYGGGHALFERVNCFRWKTCRNSCAVNWRTVWRMSPGWSSFAFPRDLNSYVHDFRPNRNCYSGDYWALLNKRIVTREDHRSVISPIFKRFSVALLRGPRSTKCAYSLVKIYFRFLLWCHKQAFAICLSSKK